MVEPVCGPPHEQQDGRINGDCGFGGTNSISPKKWLLCSLQGAGPKPLGHCALPSSAFFEPPQMLGEGKGKIVSSWFWKALERPLFFRSKAEMVCIRVESVKSILRSSLCHQNGDWSSPLPSHVWAFFLDQSGRGTDTLPNSPGPKVAAAWPKADHGDSQLPVPQC